MPKINQVEKIADQSKQSFILTRCNILLKITFQTFQSNAILIDQLRAKSMVQDKAVRILRCDMTNLSNQTKAFTQEVGKLRREVDTFREQLASTQKAIEEHKHAVDTFVEELIVDTTEETTGQSHSYLKTIAISVVFVSIIGFITYKNQTNQE